MYRYIVDNAITFTPDDLVLFRESPFAVWMERLTLENPEHGIPPDLDSIGAYPQSPQQADIVATLRSEGRNVALIDSAQEEPDRRIATLEAMRVGADFIVNGQLAFGPLSGAVDLLMRTSGFSELGDFLYIPCETRIDNSLQSPFRLCFAADLLATLQGQLPAQMLIIRGGAEVVPLQTEDHIYYYRAVQQRFFNAMDSFRKHRMPDPAESAHFGRWADCASEVLKQRASSEPPQEHQATEQVPEEAPEEVVELPQLRVAGGAGAGSRYDVDTDGQRDFAATNQRDTTRAPESATKEQNSGGVTLAEQARQLKPGSYRNGKPPGHTPSLTRIGKPLSVVKSPNNAAEPAGDAPAADEALDNLEFIGSGPGSARNAKASEFESGEAFTAAPPPNLRDTASHRTGGSYADIKSGAMQLPEREPGPPLFLPPDQGSSQSPQEIGAESAPSQQLDTQQSDATEFADEDSSSVIDLDSAPSSSLAPVVQRAEAVFKRLIRDDPMFKKTEPANPKSKRDADASPGASTFSSSLQTSDEFNDN